MWSLFSQKNNSGRWSRLMFGAKTVRAGGGTQRETGRGNTSKSKRAGAIGLVIHLDPETMLKISEERGAD